MILATTATFSGPGQYVLQLEGDDSALQTVDTVTIDVTTGGPFSLTVLVSGGGTVDVDPTPGPYPAGTPVTPSARTISPPAGSLAFTSSLRRCAGRSYRASASIRPGTSSLRATRNQAVSASPPSLAA